MSTVYLHIGTMKTGTSALQKFLKMNNAVLNRHGYTFPNMNSGMRRNYIARNAHFLAPNSKNPDEEQRIKEDAMIRKTKYEQLREIAGQYEHIILSEEVLWHCYRDDPAFWRDMREGFRSIGCDVKIIVYLRRQDVFIQSMYNQKVKADVLETREFSDFIRDAKEHEILNYYGILQMITEHVPREDVIVRVYEKGQFAGGSIFSDFLQSVGLEFTEEYDTEGASVNFGLQGNFIEIKRWMNFCPDYIATRDFLRKTLPKANAVSAGLDPVPGMTMFPAGEQEAFQKKFEECNRKVAREYLNRADGILFCEPVEEMPVWELNPDRMYQDLTMAFCESVSLLEKRIERQDEKLEALENKLKKLQEKSERQEKELQSVYKSFIFRTYRRLQHAAKRKDGC